MSRKTVTVKLELCEVLDILKCIQIANDHTSMLISDELSDKLAEAMKKLGEESGYIEAGGECYVKWDPTHFYCG